MQTVGSVIELALYLFVLLLLARLVVDWMQMFARAWEPHGVLLVALEGVYTATDPPIRAVRRILPPMRIGGMLIDLSFLVVLILANVLQVINLRLFL